MAAVAARAGVSIATVSRVINGVANKASASTVERVRAAIEALGYRPMGAGRSLRRRQSRLVAVLAANLLNPSMAAIAAVAEVALRRAGYVMVLCDTHDQPALQAEYLLDRRAQYAYGLVLLGAVRSPQLQSFVAAGERIVFVNRRNPFGERCHVGIDNRAAGTEVARWLAEQGHRDIALVHGRLSSSATADRVAGFRAELRRRKIGLPALRCATSRSADHLEIGYHGMDKLLAAPVAPRAVFCTSDLIAYGAQRRAAEADLDPARDIVFVGFDDSPLNPWVAPWLNAVRVPYADYGEAIVRSLAGTEPDIVLRHELVLRAPEGRDPSPAGPRRRRQQGL
ncbi:MAG TPA: LacI family DNA-binding transcriptional regulator [Casimicrobiaceae bacterium]|nr:LacI family DNA-binding transcriptional regulator [Casimicrobiaceae bacterium]